MTGGCPPARVIKGHMSQEEYDALGYPSIPAEWTREWMMQQIELEKVDPRVNPNLLLEETDQEFWDNMSRKPYAKAILKSERHWTQRRRLWIRQYEQVELANALRQEVVAELELCAPEVKRLVAPIMKYKITEVALTTLLRTARKQRRAFRELLATPEEVHKFHSLRLRLDEGGSQEAQRLLDEYTVRVGDRAKELRRDSEPEVAELDTDSMAKLMSQAQKLRKDGYIEWHKGAIEEAFFSWCEAEAKIYKKRLPDAAGNKLVEDLRLILLKNISQAAIKLKHWTDALRAADEALEIDDEDHKSWFRRASALEGLGRAAEAEEALGRVESCAVGRADRGRVARDVALRRARLAEDARRHRATEGAAFRRALRRGVFAHEVEDEEAELRQLEEELRMLDAAEKSKADAEVEARFAVGDRVVATTGLGDVTVGTGGVVQEVDGDGDVKVLFDGEEEAQLIFSVDFENLAKEGAAASFAEDAASCAPREDEPLLLTLEGASDLLDALASAYEDPGVQQQLRKLCRDVKWSAREFTQLLPKVALEAQRGVLPRWGFGGSEGARHAEKALQQAKDSAALAQRQFLEQQSERVTRLLFGEMYEVVFRHSD
ncbi:unnamed protein product [Effrenium voratum]|uniref:Uncharacterized protein n=1 Tax=Effrenium voratum TaxID=2562239 RepID=A0AA36IDT3_9DINO|nr:unnamed protein product [Effrenium voratum]